MTVSMLSIEICGSTPVAINTNVMIRTVVPPSIDHNNMAGEWRFILLLSTKNSEMNVTIVLTTIAIPKPSSTSVKNFKKECIVLLNFVKNTRYFSAEMN